MISKNNILDKQLTSHNTETTTSSKYCMIIFCYLLLHKFIIALFFPLYLENLYPGISQAIHLEIIASEVTLYAVVILIIYFITRNEKPPTKWLKIPILSALLGVSIMLFLFFNNWSPKQLTVINLYIDLGPKFNIHAYISHSFICSVRIGAFICMTLLLLLRIFSLLFRKN